MTVYYIDPKYFDIAKENGIHRATFESRVYEFGWDPERAATEPPRKLESRKEWAKIAKKNGIKYDTFLKRINSCGWSEKRAATEPTKSREEVSVIGNKAKQKTAKITSRIKKLAASNGICYKTLQTRIYDLKWDPERAATTAVIPKEESLKRGREAYKRIHGEYWHQKTMSID